jgi:hypothetical protein
VTGAVVCDQLTDNLISPNDFVDSGSYVYLDRDGGRIANDYDDQEVPIIRLDGVWRVWLSDIRDYSYKEAPAESTVVALNQSLLLAATRLV